MKRLCTRNASRPTEGPGLAGRGEMIRKERSHQVRLKGFASSSDRA